VKHVEGHSLAVVVHFRGKSLSEGNLFPREISFREEEAISGRRKPSQGGWRDDCSEVVSEGFDEFEVYLLIYSYPYEYEAYCPYPGSI
jgi:hypothetical protein